MARILGHSKVRRELQKLAVRSAQIHAKLVAPAEATDQERERIELAYRRGFLDGIETAERINERRSQQ